MRIWGLLPLLALTGACVAPRSAPPTPPPPRVTPPPPPPIAPPASEDWRDVPLSPGGWTYAAEPGGSIARFGPVGAPALTARCDRAARTVTLAREGPSSAAEAPILDITTSAGRQSFRGTSLTSRPAIAAQFAASEPFLDKMAFSRGRFVVAASGTARLTIPAWPEFARVVEDCRG